MKDWRLHWLGTEEDEDSAATLLVEQELGEDEEWEGWEEVTELLRDLLRKPPKPPYRGSEEVQKVAGGHLSDPSSSQASLSHRQSDAPAAASSEPASRPSHAESEVSKPVSSSRSFESNADTTSSDSLASLKAAAEETWKKRVEREK